MSGILDFLENNWQSILGSQTPTTGPTTPPSNVYSGQPFSPSGAVGPSPLADPNAAPGNPTGAPPMAPPSPQQNYQLAQGGFPTNTQGVDPNAPFPNGATSLNGSPDVPLPQPRPSGANGPLVAGPLPAPLTVGANPSTPAGPGAPDPNQFLPPNSTSTMGSPPAGAPGGLDAQLGAGGVPSIFQSRNQTIPTAIAALGKGLSAVGRQPAGTFGGTSFAAGMGGALTGGSEFQQQQEKDDLAKRKMFMDETIAGDNQSMKAQMFPLIMKNLAGRNDAMAASTANMLKNGGNGNSWFTSDVGRLHLADQETNEWKKQELQTIKNMQEAGIDVTDRQKNFDANAAKQAADNYTKYNVNPKTAQGASQNNPIDLTKIPYEKIKSMPAGTYITYPGPDGKPVTTTRKADEFNTPSMAQQQPQQQTPYPIQQEVFAPPPQME